MFDCSQTCWAKVGPNLSKCPFVGPMCLNAIVATRLASFAKCMPLTSNSALKPLRETPMMACSMLLGWATPLCSFHGLNCRETGHSA